MTAAHDAWWRIDNADDVPSPALLIFPDRAEANIRRMVAMAGDATRLTPHVKTHKLAPLVAMHLKHGIRRFKCATIAEAEMAAACGADDVLLAYQPVGPAVARVIALAQQYPATRFSVIADDAGAIDAIARAAEASGVTVPVTALPRGCSTRICAAITAAASALPLSRYCCCKNRSCSTVLA